MQALGEIRSYDDLHELMRERAAAMRVPREGLDEIVGLTRGHASKILAPMPMRKLGASTFGPVLEVLGIKLIAFEDEEAVARHAARIAEHRSQKTPRPLAPPIPAEVQRLVREQIRKLRVKAARRGGRKRAAALSPEQRSRLASKAATARWAKAPPRQRRKAIAQLNAARQRRRDGRHK